MATLWDRLLYNSDYMTDGGAILGTTLQGCCHLYSRGLMTGTEMKTFLSTTTGQSSDLDTLLATMPISLLSITNGAARAEWADKIGAVLFFAQQGSIFLTESAVKTALGV